MPAEKGLFMVCRKTGKIVGLNQRLWRIKWFFPFLVVIALLWYLVRVIPKPARAAYPCQRVGAPIALGGLAYVLCLFGSILAFGNTRKFIRRHRYAVAGVCIVVGLICSAVVINRSQTPALAEDTGTFTPSDGPNQPMGTARGINPGRVAWACDLTACNWDGSSSYWFSSANNDQSKITAMMSRAICSVAGQSAISNSWDALFKNKNGGTPYVRGEKIAIKLNLNNGGNYDNQIDASPQSVYALLDGLVNRFGVNQADITLCDPARENQCSAVYDYCHPAFPSVIYDSNLGGFTANAFAYSASGPTETSLSTAIVNSKYLITMALLKRHCTPSATFGTDGVDYGNASVTMIFKSCWGIIGDNRGNQHWMLHDWNYPMNSYNQLVDMFGSKHINGKTVLNILDGLYSGDRWNSNPHRWTIAPFNNKWPSSIFASQDPVAVESVGLDFLRAEMPLIRNADRHLHEAAQANNPPSGTVYKPDGTRLASLGVHEHWNNAVDKKYSRNLGTGNGIELVALLAGAWSVDITNPPSGVVYLQGTNIPMAAVVNNVSNAVALVAFYQNGTNLLGTSASSPFAITWSNAPMGNWTLTAVATDNTGLSVTSSFVYINVTVGPLAWDPDPATTGAQDGAGIWDFSSPNWWTGSGNVPWGTAVPDSTILGTGTGAAGTVTLGTNITVGNLAFNAAASGDYIIDGAGFTLTLAGTPSVNVADNVSPVISASVAGTGFSKTGNGALTLSGANTCTGVAAVNSGTLGLSGDNSGSSAGSTVAAGATLRLAHANGLKGALTLNSGSTLQLRADANATFAPSSITLQNASDTLNFNVDSVTAGVTGRTLALAGPLLFSSGTDQAINVTGNSTYTLSLGAITATANGHNPYLAVNINTVPGLEVVIASWTSGNWSSYLNLAGGGKVRMTGNLANNSNGSSVVVVSGGTTVTLQGLSRAPSATADGYRYFVQGGTLVLDNSGALTNNTSAAGLATSLFILGPSTNGASGSGFSPPAGVLVAANNSYNCAVYLGDASFPNGGITLPANLTNYISDGDVGFSNFGIMTLGGQNTTGINTYANPIILGWTANRGKGVTLLAAPGGTVNFSGGLRRNGTDTTAGVTVGDGAHNGVVQLTGVNTYVGGTTVAGGTLTVNSSLAAGSAVTVASGATLAGTGTINGPVTVQNGGTLSAGDSSIGTLTINNNLTLAGNVWIKINKSASPSNDLVIVSGQLTNAGCGVLTISNSGPALAAGDTFKLFSRALPNAGALTIFPPAPAPGLAWANNLALNGSLGVVAVATNPTNLAATVGNGTLTLSWPGDHMGWTLQTQTNPWTAGIGTNWVPVADSGSTNRIVFPVDPAKGSVFYRLTYP